MSQQSTFIAWITRMSLIKRWALMHTHVQENVSEHSHQVAVIAHLLTVIHNHLSNDDLNPEKSATLALFHEVSETKMQDVNSNTKYQTPEFTKEFKKLEELAERECLNTLPQFLQGYYEGLIVQNEVDPNYKRILKAADIISAYIKALNELRFSNVEFEHVKVKLDKKLDELRKEQPAVEYFMTSFISSCNATVDQLAGIDKSNH